MRPNATLTTVFILALLAAAGLQALSAEDTPGTAPARPELKFEVLQVPYPYHALQPIVPEYRFVLIMRVKLPQVAVHSLQRDLLGLLSRIPDKQLPPQDIRKLLLEGRVIRYLSETYPGRIRPPRPAAASYSRPGVRSIRATGYDATYRTRRRPPTREPLDPRREPGEYAPRRPGPPRRGPAMDVRARAELGTGTRRVPSGRPRRGPATVVCEIALLAQTVEQAKQLARGLIAAYDVGWTEHERQNLLHAIEQNKRELAQLQPRLDEAAKLRKTLTDKAEKFPDIPQKTIDELKTKGWLLEVELAGVRARIDAGEKLWKGLTKITREMHSGIELGKIAAQIDMAGLLGQRQRVKKLLEEAEGRKAAYWKLEKHERRFGPIRGRKLELEDNTGSAQETLASDLFKPLEVVGNRATIQPIRWPEETPRNR